MGFNETVQYLYDLQKFGTKLGLDNTRSLLRLLGDPHNGRRFLHVTGTNGKGSVSAMAASMSSAAGVRTGLYTSPHLVSFTERFRLDGLQASEDDVVRLAERLKNLLSESDAGRRPTFFEFTTAMALDWFARQGAEAVVLEVGMGGRLDSTNVVTPDCTVITNVEVEHIEYLGDTVELIAYEKAGIIKPGVPLVTAEEKPEALRVIEDACSDMAAPMYLLGRDYGYVERGVRWESEGLVQSFDYEGRAALSMGLRYAWRVDTRWRTRRRRSVRWL